MSSEYIKSAKILLLNPQILLFLIAYLIILRACLPVLIYSYGNVMYSVICLLIFLLTAAFLAGWFGIIKGCILLYKKNEAKNEDSNIEENENSNEKNFGFFSSVSIYILPLIFLIILFGCIQFGIPLLSDKIFGSPDALIGQIAMLSGDTNSLMNFFSTLSPEDKNAILGRGVFCIVCFVLCNFLTMFSIPALYQNKSKNPFLAVKEGLFALFKKFPTALFFFLFVFFVHILLFFLEAVCLLYGNAAVFFAAVLRFYYIAYVVVLLFFIYEENFCNNGAYGVGENKTLD